MFKSFQKHRGNDQHYRWSLLSTALLLLATPILPDSLHNDSHLVPYLTLIGVYYWGFYGPRVSSMAIAGCWLIGLLQDLISGTPLGLNALLLVCGYSLTNHMLRRWIKRRTVLVLWVSFILVVVIIYSIQSGVLFLLGSDTALPFAKLFIQGGLTWLLFPLFHSLLHATHRVR